ncbi:hypothetical protein G7046_g7458 [Stylonectria norvegica]|nr:hypothetical protein G7046_g7458 [Stylonectria norvegica]
MSGVQQRVNSYKPGASQLPIFVKRAFDRNYTLAHRGLVCWTPLPTDACEVCYATSSPQRSLAPWFLDFARHVQKPLDVSGVFFPTASSCNSALPFLLLEALFDIIFHTCYEASTYFYTAQFVRWPREIVWKPLCSHLPLKEAIRGGIELSVKQLETITAVRKARKHEQDASQDRTQSLGGQKPRQGQQNHCKGWKQKHYCQKLSSRPLSQGFEFSLEQFEIIAVETSSQPSRNSFTCFHGGRSRGLHVRPRHPVETDEERHQSPRPSPGLRLFRSLKRHHRNHIASCRPAAAQLRRGGEIHQPFTGGKTEGVFKTSSGTSL